MPAKDIFHDVVRSALENDGWVITADPLFLKLEGEQKMYVDLAAERLVAAQKGQDKIAVEIKSFSGESFLGDFHTAVGQFLNYRVVLARLDPDRKLFLAVPIDTYQEYFQDGVAPLSIEAYDLKLIIYNPDTQELTQWIS